MKNNTDTQSGDQAIPAVNFHVVGLCNMACIHCFAANLEMTHMPLEKSIKIVNLLWQAGFKKINFAGGEPMMYPELDCLIKAAKHNDMITSIVTNGTMLTDAWLKHMSGHLDWVALSIDSADSDIHKQSGRATSGVPLAAQKYTNMCRSIKQYNIRLKVNTVVTRYNCDEDMTGFIREVRPERWKVMQALIVNGQNDSNSEYFEVTPEQFAKYMERNKVGEDIKTVPENKDLMTGSYVMVDPIGRFFDNTKGSYTYSRPILQVGVSNALQDVKTDFKRFILRGGKYDW